MNKKTRILLAIFGVFAAANAAVMLTGHFFARQDDVREQAELMKRWKERVSELIGEQRHQEAISALRNYLRHAPDDGNIRRMLGKVLFAAGRYEEARETYYAALLNDPDDFISRNNIGVVLVKMGRRRDALRELNEAFDVSEQGVFVAANLARCHELYGDASAAAKYREIMRKGARNNAEELVPEDALMLDAEEVRRLQVAAVEKTARPEQH